MLAFRQYLVWLYLGWQQQIHQETKEEYTSGELTTITADFRKYASVEDSISDHSAYLLGAMNGSKKRYDGLKGCTDYKKAAQIIKDGGYATSSTYVDNLCSIIEKYSLTQYDAAATETKIVWYRVRKPGQTVRASLVPIRCLPMQRHVPTRTPATMSLTRMEKQSIPKRLIRQFW